MNKEEIWKDIIGFEGLYQISNYGRVKSIERFVARNNSFKPVHDKILKQFIGWGYFRVRIYKDSVPKTYSVHRLVGLHFIENKLNKPCINHIDENKLNNYVCNLEWATNKENSNHGTLPSRISAKISKKVIMKTKNGDVVKIFNSAMEAQNDGFSRFCISQCCNNRIKTHKGYIWEWYK